MKPSGDPRCLYFNKAVTCGHFQTKAILWVQKGENKPEPKAETNARKDAAEQGCSASKGEAELRSLNGYLGKSVGKRKHGLTAKKE